MSDPREQFYVVEEQFREDIRRRLAPLSNEELQDIAALFHPSRLSEVPLRYQSLGYKVRSHINIELRNREKESAPE